MNITLNGKPYNLAQAITIKELLELLELKQGQVAIEHNREIVPKSLHSKTMVNENDVIEIVAFIGGG